jgi:GGDEF domain-containing protein
MRLIFQGFCINRLDTQLAESESRHSNFLKLIIDLQNFKRLNQPFKGPIWQKRSQGYNVLSQPKLERLER